MKLLTIKSLLLASAMACSATAINFCSSGSVQTNIFVENATPGNSDFIDGCQVGTNVAIEFNIRGAPNVRTAPAMTMRASNSQFGVDTRMVILGHETYQESLVNKTACNFVIENNRFGAGGMVYVRGAFSPSTTITINRNTFDFGIPLTTLFPSPPGATENFASAIYLHDIQVMADVAIRINSNTIKGNSTNGFVAVNAINFGGDVHYNGDRASIEVNNNNIDIVCNATSSFGTAIGGSASMYFFSAASKFSIENNRINSTGSSSVLLHPAIISLATGSGSTSISNNVIKANTAGMAPVGTDATYRPVIRAGVFNIQNSAINVWVANNTIDVTGSLASIGFGEDITGCSTGCALYLKDNQITATGADPRFHFLGGVELSGSGALWITGNTVARSLALPTASPIYFGKNLRINDQSAVAVTGNTFNAQAPILMAELSATAQNAFTRQDSASLFLCGNTFGGQELNTLAAVRAATSTLLGEAATVDNCPTVTTTLAPTTTGTGSSSTAETTDSELGNATTTDVFTQPGGSTTTTDPLPTGDNKGVATSVAGALVAAAMAVTAMLL
jgi:hypothetical protein